MAAKPLRAGSEVDAWCTKCRMDLLHRIIAMQGTKIERVECRTCNGHHNYRAPKSARVERPAAGERAPRKSEHPKTPGVRATAAAEAERLRSASWEKQVLGQPLSAFKAYQPSVTFSPGERIKHGKFGDGYIIRVIDRQKVEAMFKDGPRTLAQALDA